MPRRRPVPFSLDQAERAVGDPPLPPEVAALHDAAISRLEWLRDSARRSGVQLILVALLMELFRQSAIADVQIGPVQFHDLAAVQKGLPVLGAYLIFDVCYTVIRLGQAQQFLWNLTLLHRPKLAASTFAALSRPPYPALFTGFPTLLQTGGPLASILRGPRFGRDSGVLSPEGPLILAGGCDRAADVGSGDAGFHCRRGAQVVGTGPGAGLSRWDSASGREHAAWSAR